MARLRTDPNQKVPRPYEYFDMICGTSTGGCACDPSRITTLILSVSSLITIMLGRLRMSTKQARDEYIELAKKVFGKKKAVIGDGAFKATKLEKVVKDVVRRYGGDSSLEEPMLDPRSDVVCKA